MLTYLKNEILSNVKLVLFSFICFLYGQNQLLGYE